MGLIVEVSGTDNVGDTTHVRKFVNFLCFYSGKIIGPNVGPITAHGLLVCVVLKKPCSKRFIIAFIYHFLLRGICFMDFFYFFILGNMKVRIFIIKFDRRF